MDLSKFGITLLMLLRCFILCIITITVQAQPAPRPTLNIGDPAPPIQVRAWLKGTPVERFEKGQVYVVEFWAKWCAPCRAAIPRISALAEKYRGKVTFIGIDVFEQGINSFEIVKSFVDSMGSRMNYAVAAEDSNFMAQQWLVASGQTGIPGTIVVNAEGKLAWIGHPANLEKNLQRILKNKWDIHEAMTKRIRDRYLDSLDSELYYRLIPYRENNQKPGDLGKPDLMLLAINSIVINEPRLEYAPRIAYHTFASLLKTDPSRAYAFAKKVMEMRSFEENFDIVIDVIRTYKDVLPLSPEIYRLGAEACQQQIDQIAYPEIVDMHYYYSRMADWYLRGNCKSKAKQAQRKADQLLKSKKDNTAKKN